MPNLNLPSLFFDPKSIKSLRERVQKTYEKEEFWAYYFIRRISIYITAFIIKTGITPNQLTVVGIFFGLLSSVFFILGGVGYSLIGVLFYELSYLFDCIDGEVARYKEQHSKKGMWYDVALRYIHIISFCCSIYSTYYIFLDRFFLKIIVYILFIYVITQILSDEPAILYLNKKTSEFTFGLRKRHKIIDMLIFLFASMTGYFFILIPLLIICGIWDNYTLLIIWCSYHFSVSILRSLYKLIIVNKE
jgi:hypothetical protein